MLKQYYYSPPHPSQRKTINPPTLLLATTFDHRSVESPPIHHFEGLALSFPTVYCRPLNSSMVERYDKNNIFWPGDGFDQGGWGHAQISLPCTPIHIHPNPSSPQPHPPSHLSPLLPLPAPPRAKTLNVTKGGRGSGATRQTVVVVWPCLPSCHTRS